MYTYVRFFFTIISTAVGSRTIYYLCFRIFRSQTRLSNNNNNNNNKLLSVSYVTEHHYFNLLTFIQ